MGSGASGRFSGSGGTLVFHHLANLCRHLPILSDRRLLAFDTFIPDRFGSQVHLKVVCTSEVTSEIRAISKEQEKEQERPLQICCAFPSGSKATSGRGIDKTMWCKMDEAFYGACIDPTDYRPKRQISN